MHVDHRQRARTGAESTAHGNADACAPTSKPSTMPSRLRQGSGGQAWPRNRRLDAGPRRCSGGSLPTLVQRKSKQQPAPAGTVSQLSRPVPIPVATRPGTSNPGPPRPARTFAAGQCLQHVARVVRNRPRPRQAGNPFAAPVMKNEPALRVNRAAGEHDLLSQGSRRCSMPICSNTSPSVYSEGRLTTTPIAPTSSCWHTRVTASEMRICKRWQRHQQVVCQRCRRKWTCATFNRSADHRGRSIQSTPNCSSSGVARCMPTTSTWCR